MADESAEIGIFMSQIVSMLKHSTDGERQISEREIYRLSQRLADVERKYKLCKNN
jgi:hypothetical protein